MQLYWCPRTRASRALWMLEEVRAVSEIRFERVLVDLRGGGPPPEGFAAASPMGKVPALRDGEARMADSTVICLYLADRYAPSQLSLAVDDPQRGDFLFWMLYSASVVEPAMAEKVNGLEPKPGQNGWGSFDKMIDTWSARLADRDWVMGKRFTAADVMLGSTANFMQLFGLMPDAPVLKRYVERCIARPAYATALAADSESGKP